MTYVLTVTTNKATYTKEFGLLSTAVRTLRRIQAAGYVVDLTLLLHEGEAW